MSNIVATLEALLTFKADDKSKKEAENTAIDLKNVVSKALGMIGVTLSAAGIIAYTKSAIEAASETEQMKEKFEAVFLELSDEADEWAGNLAESIGRSKNSIKTYLADQQNLLVGFGMERDAAMELSEEMTSAAINIASFNNIDDDTAVNAMSKALMGQTESAKTLGAVLNDNTIAMAMADLGYQQSFSDLDEATKMQVRFHSIVMQSPDAFREENGVVGDAALSMDTYESKLRAFSATMKDIKENIGSFILPYASKILTYVSQGANALRKLTEKLGDANEEGTKANKLLKALDKVMSSVMTGMRRAVSVIKTIVNAVGGAENAIKILGVAISTYLVFKNAEKIKKGIKAITDTLKGMNTHLLVIVAVAVLVFAVIQDIVYFMQGKGSLIGDLIEANGGDADKVRETFQGILDGIKSFVGKIAEAVKPIGKALANFWGEHGTDILKAGGEFLTGTLAVILGAITGFAYALKPIIKTIVSLFKTIASIRSGNLFTIGSNLSELFSNIGSIFTGFSDNFAAVVNNILGTHFPEDLGQLASDAMDALLDGLNSVWSDITSFFSNIVTTATTTIGELPSKMLQWGKDMISNFIQGLKETPIGETVSGIANTVSKFLHHSTPDEGPLKNDDEWGYDLMDNFVTGIKEKESDIKAAVSGIASVVADTKGGFGVLGADVTGSMATSGTTRTNSIIQNITFSNTFNGDTASNQRTAATQMERNATDTTTYLANAIAFGR